LPLTVVRGSSISTTAGQERFSGSCIATGACLCEGRSAMKYVDLLKNQYESFPYPTNTSRNGGYQELVNLVKLLRLDCGYHLQGKRILDAGTGTGFRVCDAAAWC